jgi:hypothetical protein
MRIAFVSCTRAKQADPQPARDLYMASRWFRAARAYAETFDRWLILSARYGLVHPDKEIAPYQESLKAKTADARREWAFKVSFQLQEQAIPTGSHVVLLAGRFYRDPLLPYLANRGYTCEMPLARYAYALQIEQLQQLAERAGQRETVV